jgi:hypothetical protein
MEKATEEEQNNCLPPVTNNDAALMHFRLALASGKQWYIALLEAIGLWTSETEDVDGQCYNYLIDSEAFDWLLLAERICSTVSGLVPEDEKCALLFQGKPPIPLEQEEFKHLIGAGKYHQFLNFFYGVTVEDALVQAVREEVRKERHSNGMRSRRGEEDMAYMRIYGETELALLKEFRREKHHHLQTPANLTEMKQFAYWRFKFRIRTAEKARVASDTQKALLWLKRHGLHQPT